MIRSAALLTLLNLLALPATGSEPLTLAQALRQAGAASLPAEAARLSLASAREDQARARARYWPELQIQGGYRALEERPELLSQAISLGSLQLGPFSTPPLSVPPQVFPTEERSSWRYRASLQYLVWDFGRRSQALDATRDRVDSVALQGGAEVRRAQAEAAARYLTLLDLKAQRRVLAAQANLEVVTVRKQAADAFLADVKAKLDAQTATELDLLRAQSESLAVEPENLQAQADLDRAVEVLDGQLGLDPKTPLALASLGQPDLGPKPAGVERSEIAQLRQDEAMYRENDKILKSDLRPKFDFNASYGYQAGKTDLLFKEPYDTWRVNVTMKFPIFDGLRSAGKRAQNTAQLEEVRQARIDRERAIAVEKSTADRELTKAVALNEAARKAHDAAAEALRVSREFFDQGLITSLDLLQAERSERQAESQRRQAELGVWAAIFDQRRALGLPPL